MKRKISLLAALILALALAFSLSSCGEDDHVHTEADPVIENYEKGTCAEGVKYELVVYCTECDEEVSRTPKTEESDIHTEADAVIENVELYDCAVGGTYEAVVYCKDCKKELSRVEKELAAKEHSTKGYVENLYSTITDCTVGGKYYEITCCEDCGVEIGREEKEFSPAAAHSFVSGACSICSTFEKTTAGLDLVLNEDGLGYTVVGVTEQLKSASIVLGYYGEETKLPITAIAENAFKGNTSIKSLTLGKDVVSIGKNAFTGCEGLEAIYVVDLAKWCELDIEVDLEAEEPIKTHPLCYVKNLYVNGELLDKLVIPNGVTEIKPYAFYSLDHVKHLVIPPSVTKIGMSAFAACEEISKVIFSEGLVEIGEGAFMLCNDLAAISLPNSLVKIEKGAFMRCKELSTVKFGKKLTTIGDYAFSGSVNIKEIKLPSKLETIGNGAFEYCKLVRSVKIPVSVTKIGVDAFFGCTGITEVYTEDIEKWCSITFASYTANPLSYAGELYVITIEDEKKVNKLVTELVIPASVTVVKAYSFYGCDSLVSVTVPEGVTAIKNDAFSSCASLNTINLPATLTVIGARAFDNCDSLENVVVGSLEKWELVEFKDKWSNPMVYATNLIEAEAE